MVSIRLQRQALLLTLGLAAAFGSMAEARRKPDLADAVAGVYRGDVISDSAGPSRASVTLTLTRIGPNEVGVTSDYPRLGAAMVKLERAMDKVVNRGGDTAFVYDRGKLDVSFHNEVSWSGRR